MKRTIHRRKFLKSTLTVAGGLSLAGLAASPRRPAQGPALMSGGSPSEKLNIGIIGVNNRGKVNTEGVTSQNIAALCDIDSRYLAEAYARFPKAKTYRDWRQMLEQKDLDAVVISTTDHTHALAAVMAMRLGKHVYCEKPLANSVHEARVVRETYLSRKGKIATQMGTQIHATDNYRRAVELVKGGSLGPVREAHVWCNRVGAGGGLPVGSQPVPDYLDWDLWLGPAPDRPYNSAYFPGCAIWNHYWDFGNGTLGDMGSHLIDLPFWALDLGDPTTVEARGTPVSPVTCPKWLISTWEHPARGDRPAVKLTWYDADKRPPAPPGIDINPWWIGVIFVGDNGKLLVDYEKHILLPKKDYRGFVPPKVALPPSLGHYQEWIHACKTGAPTLCNFDYSAKLIEHNLLGNVAYRVGKKLEWDAANLKAVNCPQADQYIRCEYRKGWTI